MTTEAKRDKGSAGEAMCDCIRAKGMYLPPNARADSLTPDGSATAVFWCLKTMKMTGPDERLVAPDLCIPARACYREPA